MAAPSPSEGTQAGGPARCTQGGVKRHPVLKSSSLDLKPSPTAFPGGGSGTESKVGFSHKQSLLSFTMGKGQREREGKRGGKEGESETVREEHLHGYLFGQGFYWSNEKGKGVVAG